MKYKRIRAKEVVPTRKPSVVAAAHHGATKAAERAESHDAARLVRHKIDTLHLQVPGMDATKARQKLTEHEKFMQGLVDSGTSLAEVLEAWHDYYVTLPATEKIKVWQEFRGDTQAARPYQPAPDMQDTVRISTPATAVEPEAEAYVRPSRRHRQLRSLGFGLAFALVFVVVSLFGFFNEVIISPFIQPSRTVTATPLLQAPTTEAVSPEPKILIPKINIEIPVDYSLTTTDEQTVETALDSGVVHYPTTVRPGQPGNAAFFGHSSNNIFNPGKYKFAFVLLDRLVEKDIFYMAYEGKMYGYEVISTKIVKPSDVSVLGPVEGQTSTATLITCNPPGTSLNRLVVVGKQISPNPDMAGSADSTAPPPAPPVATPGTDLPDNGKTLWERMWSAFR